MSDNIPFEIQVEIMKMLPVKSLIQFRSVSKQWKSMIDSYEFITNYHVSNKHNLLDRYVDPESSEQKCVSITDNHTFPEYKSLVTVPMSVIQLDDPILVGISQGLICFYSYRRMLLHVPETKMAVIWNPTISKSVSVPVHIMLGWEYDIVIGFGVCPQTSDPKVVKITFVSLRTCPHTITTIPSQVEVFRLSSGVWRSLSLNVPRISIAFIKRQVDVDGFIYWLAFDRITVDGVVDRRCMIISFDIKNEEFTEAYLHVSLAYNNCDNLCLFKVRESLAVIEYLWQVNERLNYVWISENGDPKTFTKIFTINPQFGIYGGVYEFRSSGEPIIEMITDYENVGLFVYDPNSKDVKDTWITSKSCSMSAVLYMETLLLLDH